MREFVYKVAVFTAIQGAILLGFLAFYPSPEKTAYIAATLDKHRILDETPSPRVLLVGGSNLCFGVRSGVLEEELGIPVVNLGLHAGLGLPILLNEAYDASRSGDMVVLSLEYTQYHQGPSGLVQLQLLEARPQSYELFDLEALKICVDEVHLFLGGMARTSLRHAFGRSVTPPRPYRRDCFNGFGDVDVHYEDGPRDKVVHHIQRAPRDLSGPLSELESFVQRCRRKGVAVALSFPPRPAPLYAKEKDLIESIHRGLDRETTIALLDTPSERAYPWTAFYDTDYHLSGEGSMSRTRDLARRIRRWQRW